MDILAFLQCLRPLLTTTTLRQLSRIAFALLAMTGRVTMLGIARWAGTGGSYRTVQRFFYTVIPWASVLWQFFRRHIFRPDDVYILVGDEVVVTKAGRNTYGLDRFFSGVLQKVVPGVSFFTLSLVSTQERRAFPVQIEQVVRSDEEKAARQAQRAAQMATEPPDRRKPGRPQGSKNQQQPIVLTPELQRIQRRVQEQQRLMGDLVSLTYLALDGHFGNHPALYMTRQCNLHLISKLRSDAALYFPYQGPYSGRGPRRKYGDRVNYQNIPDKYLKQTTVEEGVETRIYQAQLLHKEFSQPLNVVILVKTNLKTQAWAHVILFSSDLALPYDKLIEYYSLRFQIEFNFRDAKQYWGLEDFMNVTATAVTNAASLSLFMVNLVHVLLRDVRQTDPDLSVLDLKAYGRGYKYVTETIKMLPQKPDESLIDQIFRQVAHLGSIHTTEVLTSPS